MTLTPEERRKIYEEEKVKIESEEAGRTESASSTSLQPNVAGLLCYLGWWVSGIVFIVIEQKNRLVRFHALQSIILFGAVHLALLMLAPIPFVGWFFATVIGVGALALWITLMVNAYQGHLLRIPGAADLAERMIGIVPEMASSSTSGAVKQEVGPATPAPESQKAYGTVDTAGRGRGGRIAASAVAIAWSVALLVFLNFFNDYIAYYHVETVAGVSTWVREPILTGDLVLWLPVVTVALVIGIAAHIMLLAVDKYVVREATLTVLDVFSLVVVATLVAVFPFDFDVFGNSDLAAWLDIGVRITLVLISFGIGIGVLVRLIKLLVNIARGKAKY
jgi:uncharacterized membrane protein